MWRNVLNGSRDMQLIHAAGGLHFTGARKLGSGAWKINACPMDGDGLLVTKGQVTSAEQQRDS